MTLTLLPEQLDHIRHHAERTYPEECCGLLLGHVHLGETSRRQGVEVIPLENTWDAEVEADLATVSHPSQALDRRRRYWIDPRDLLTAQRQARDRGLNIIGIYHSHPDHPAEPSECDRQLAWAEYSYVIVSVCQERSQDLQSWSLDDRHQFQPEAIEIAAALPLSPSTL
ncbi:M67 family metallopeptidase [Sphaerothrix gracilis]|uniref:M67 family metallopeptidase n=1 Tax=Sphaerothrix gracilis TaxID=3151835 RepID=UPI0031FC0E3A